MPLCIYMVYQYLQYTGSKDDYAFVREKLYDKMEEYTAMPTAQIFSIGMDTDT